MIAEVRLWGRTIGAVAEAEGRAHAVFQYAPEFVGSGIEPSPLVMPLATRPYEFPELPPRTFHGLPGLLADSLPDRFGNALIDAWLTARGRRPESFGAVERLCYTGARGMGALEFAPSLGPRARKAERVDVDALVRLASDVLAARRGVRGKLGAAERADALREILRVGTSAGGARAKAVIAWNRTTNEVRSGQVPADDGFEHWLIKFDGVAANKDRELDLPAGYGAIEYAYHLMAVAAGVRMSECRILEENGRRHFMTRRFDRPTGRDKLHMQSLGGLAHFDFNQAGAYGYEQALRVAREIGCGPDDAEQLFRRAAFNVVARNQDDHVKNVAFLMDREGRWSLAPAYDVVYAHNPDGAWTSSHQMTLNGKRDGFVVEDFKACARAGLLKRGRAERILEEVRAAVSRWTEFAEEAEVPAARRKEIARAHRLTFAKS